MKKRSVGRVEIEREGVKKRFCYRLNRVHLRVMENVLTLWVEEETD